VEAFALTGATIVTPKGLKKATSLVVEGTKFAGFARPSAVNVAVGDAFVYPALINAHDHLRGNYLPRVGPPEGRYYANWGPWDADLKSSAVYKERANLTVEQMYWLGAYKCLFSGVVTVNDHFPHQFNEPFIDVLPVRVIREYALAHECSSYDLKWGDGLEIEHARAVEHDWPFITHLEEGFDLESMDGVGILERAACLTEHDLLIHCIGFSEEDIRKVKKAQASVAWCPASNFLMFNVTCKIRKLLRAGINVALGTDSTHTGSQNLLAEMRYARNAYRELYGEDLPAKTLFEMVTINAARAFRIARETGSIESGKLADIAVFRAKTDDPFENLANSTMEDLELLVHRGAPLLGLESRYASLFAGESRPVTRIMIGGRDYFVVGDPVGLYKNVRKAIGFEKKLDYLPFEP
jgi:cytosine/adenosine deaminase-related metal-dependent hydrolase